MLPFRQRNALHVRCVPKPQTSSPSGIQDIRFRITYRLPSIVISPPRGCPIVRPPESGERERESVEVYRHPPF